MAEAIRLVLSHIPAIMFVAALVVTTIVKQPSHLPSRLLAWMLLLSVGVEESWAGLFHVFAPRFAAASIGWEASPFQFEIGVADIAIGLTAVASFWSSLPFKAATVIYISLFYLGVAVGHIRQAIFFGDYAENNFGLLLIITIVKIVLLPTLCFIAQKASSMKSVAD